MLIFMTLAAILTGPLIVYWNWACGYNGDSHLWNRLLCSYENRRL